MNLDVVFDYDTGFPGYNLFAYCGNSPVFRIDVSGKDSDKTDEGDVTDDDMRLLGGGGDGKPNPGGSGTPNPVPQAAKDTLSYIQKTGSPPTGYKGGREFMNDGRNGGQVLPASGAPYHEYDIYPKVKGVARGTERIVISSTGLAWYTNDHYQTFIFMGVKE